MRSSERPLAVNSRRQRSMRGSNAMRIVRWCSSPLGRSSRPETTCSRAIAHGLRQLDVRVALATGSTDPRRLGPLPSEWLVGSYLPQVSILRRASVLVTHAGNNSVTEALAEGVPMLALPFSTDQFDGAAAIEAAGLGFAADPNRVTPLEVAEAVRCMIGTSHPALDRLAVELAVRPGAGIARAAVDEWLGPQVRRGQG